jgi:hypothetical protein
LLKQVVVTGIGIQKMFLVVGFEQKLMGMLTVDLYQLLAEIAQLRERYRCAIDKAA